MFHSKLRSISGEVSSAERGRKTFNAGDNALNTGKIMLSVGPSTEIDTRGVVGYVGYIKIASDIFGIGPNNVPLMVPVAPVLPLKPITGIPTNPPPVPPDW